MSTIADGSRADSALDRLSLPTRLGLFFVLLCPLVYCFSVGRESLRLVVISLSIVLLGIGAIVESRSRIAPAPAWISWVCALSLAWSLAGISQYSNIYETLSAITLLAATPLLFLVLASSEGARKRVFQLLPPMILVSAYFISIVGFLQKADLVLPCFRMSVGSRGMASVFGESNIAGIFAGMLMPMVAAGVLARWKTRTFALWLAALAMLSAYLLLSNSRAGLLATGVSGAFLGGMLLLKGTNLRKPAAIGFAASALGLIAGFLLLGSAGQSKWSRELPQTANVSWRADLWSSTLRMAMDRTLTGWGPGNFHRVLHRYRSSDGAAWHLMPDQPTGYLRLEGPHQAYVHLLSEQGIPGLAFPLILLIGAFVGYLKWRRGREPDEETIWHAALAAMLVAFFIGAFFNTLSLGVAHWIYAFLGAGMLAGTIPSSETASSRWILRGVAAVSIAFFAVCLFRHGRMVQAERLMANGAVAKALAVHPWSVDGRKLAAQDLEKQGRLDDAQRQADMLLAWDGDNPKNLHRSGTLALKRGKLDEAEERFRTCSTRAAPWWAPKEGLGRVMLARGNYAAAEPLFAEAAKLLPTWADAHRGREAALRGLGRIAEAEQAAAAAKAAEERP